MMAWEGAVEGRERASEERALFGTTLMVLKGVPIRTGLQRHCGQPSSQPALQKGSPAEVTGTAWSLIGMKFL